MAFGKPTAFMRDIIFKMHAEQRATKARLDHQEQPIPEDEKEWVEEHMKQFGHIFDANRSGL